MVSVQQTEVSPPAPLDQWVLPNHLCQTLITIQILMWTLKMLETSYGVARQH